MKHIFVISGGEIEDETVRSMMRKRKPDCVIAADSGMEFLYRNELIPDVIVGDFDSVRKDVLDFYRSRKEISFHELNPVKDDTDTEYAVRLALQMGAEEITMFGATGSRLDHVLGNIELLGIGLSAGVPITLIDAHNRIRMVSDGVLLKKKEQYGTYVSLLPYTASVAGVTLTGFKYPLVDYCLKGFCSIGVSNEIVEEEAAISFEEGILLVIESRD